MWRRTSGIPIEEQRAARIVTIIGTTLFALVLCNWRPWQLFAKSGFSGDFYDIQAQAFLHGRLSVPAEAAGIEGFLVDGKTFLYYGPILAIVRLPAALFGSMTEGRLTRLSMIIGFVALCTVTFHLARRVATSIGAASGGPWRPAILVTAVACSPALALASAPTVYNETELWALVLILATFVALIDLVAAPTMRAGVIAGLVACATVLTRVSVGLGAVAAVAVCAVLLWRRGHLRIGLAALATGAAGVVVHIALNIIKFNSLFDLPGDRQVLTLLDPSRAEWFAGNNNSFFGLGFLPTTVVHYLRPDAIAFERLVPFVRFGPRAHEFGSYPLESNTPASSLTATATLLVVLAIIGAVIAVRRRAWTIAPFLVGAVVAAAPTLLIGFIANRYLVDLLPALIVLGAVAVAGFHTHRRTLAAGAVAALAVWGAWANAGLATWLGHGESLGFTSLRYGLDDAVFGGAPPSVVRVEPGASAPRDGVVGIDGPCDGLYVAANEQWVALELAEGVRRLRGSIDPSESTTVFDGPGETRLDIVPTPAGNALVATYRDESGSVAMGAEIPWDGGTVDLRVTSDPVGGGIGRGLSVSIDGTDAFHDFSAPDLLEITVTDAFERQDSGSGVETCEELVRRGS